ncbi:MAG: hypothetical protein KDD67_15930 [Ignavibacteriae bacterium]|nr:hypothetical protein [Ignavibacteriota bacterium]MCB9215688.1 hypothetical protein [Ignavibacteria bacterium]
MKLILWSLLVLFPALAAGQSYDTVRVCTYNVLNFSSTENTLDRIDEIRLILNEIRPRVLMVQELASEEGKKLFEDSIASRLNLPLTPVVGSFRVTQDSYVWVYYDAGTFENITTITLENDLRDQKGGHLRHLLSGDSLAFVTLHWKAGDTPDDEILRAQTGRFIRNFVQINNQIGEITATVVAGDMNVYTYEEPGYQFLLEELIDPINRSGAWHNNADFADVHTQSPRVRQFGGGVNGGMDDRFDQILLSPTLTGFYLPGSYTTFGNDGNHFNDSINAQPNTAVSPELAQALHDASDHLPVYLDLVFEKKTTGVEDEEVWTERLLDLW